MKKKLLVAAIAGAFLSPAALAQVTMSGKVMATFGQFKIGGSPAVTGNDSDLIVDDESSRLIVTMRDDIGGGLAGIAKADFRFSVDAGAIANSGESYVGLTSPTMGTLTLGRHDLHYGKHASFTGVHGGLSTNPVAVFDQAGAGTLTVANRTRTPNVIRYGSPKFGGMGEIVLAYSTSGSTGTESDIGTTARKGSAWNIAPTLFGRNYEAGFSYWKDEPDGTATREDTGMALYGWMKFGGFRVGLAWNRAEIENPVTGVTVSERDVFGIPINWSAGPHNVYFDYYIADDDEAPALAGVATGATFWGLTYGYDLSKRTTVALSYSTVRNDAGAAYNLFSPQAAIVAGQDPRQIGITLQHRY